MSSRASRLAAGRAGLGGILDSSSEEGEVNNAPASRDVDFTEAQRGSGDFPDEASLGACHSDLLPFLARECMRVCFAHELCAYASARAHSTLTFTLFGSDASRAAHSLRVLSHACYLVQIVAELDCSVDLVA